MEEDEGESGAIRAAVRSAKKSSRPTKIGMPEARRSLPSKTKSKAREKKRKSGSVAGKKGLFDKDFGEKRGGAGSGREGVRANKSDKIGGMGKKNGKGKGKGNKNAKR